MAISQGPTQPPPPPGNATKQIMDRQSTLWKVVFMPLPFHYHLPVGLFIWKNGLRAVMHSKTAVPNDQ